MPTAEVVIERECRFKARPDKKRGCDHCGAAKSDPVHLGAPPTFRILGSGNKFVYQNIKHTWERILGDKLEQAGLPKGLARVVVEGEATFPDRTRRDQGNHRMLIEKALGDVLVDRGWLEDDDWHRYEFGGLAYRYEKNVSRTRLLLIGTPA